MARPKHPLSLARWKYNKHKAQSKFRSIPFNFTFEEWHHWWLSNGVDKNVNVEWPGGGRPCMCRYNDQGPYELNNVYFATNSQNVKDSLENIRTGVRPKPKTKLSKIGYRWGDTIVDRYFLESKGVDYTQAYTYFRPEVYEHGRKVEFKKLRIRYREQFGAPRDRVRWEGANGQWFNLLKDAAASFKIRGELYRAMYRRGDVEKRYEGMTLTEFILANTKYPDPLLPTSDKC